MFLKTSLNNDSIDAINSKRNESNSSTTNTYLIKLNDSTEEKHKIIKNARNIHLILKDRF